MAYCLYWNDRRSIVSKIMKLNELYKFTENANGTYTISADEFKRFEQNFEDYLQIRYALKHNNYVNDMYTKLYEYSKWYNKI